MTSPRRPVTGRRGLDRPAPLPTFAADTRLARRYWPMLLVGMLVGALAGVAVHASRPAAYSATEAVLLAPMSAYLDLSPSDGPAKIVSVDTDAEFAVSDQVIDAVAAATGYTADEVRARSSITAPALTSVLRFTFTAADPDTAAQGASVAGESLLAARRQALLAAPHSYIELMREQAQGIRRLLADESVDPATSANLADQVDRLETAVQRLERQAGSSGRVLTTARPPVRPDPGNPEVPITSGAMLGLLGGLTTASLWDRRRRRASAAEEGPAQRGADVAASGTEDVRVGRTARAATTATGPYRRGGLVRDTFTNHRRLVALFVVIGAAAGLAAGAAVTNHYVATVGVVIGPLPGNAYAPDGRRDNLTGVANEAQSVRSDAVLDAVNALSGGQLVPANLARRIKVAIPPRTSTLRISVWDADPQTAQRLAEDVAASYLDFRELRAADALDLRRTGVSAQIVSTSAELQQAVRDTLRGTARQAAYHRDLAVSLSTRLLEQQSELSRIERTSTNPGRIVVHAVEPSTPAGPASVFLALLGAAAGFGLGLVVAFGREVGLDRIRREADVLAAGVGVLTVANVGGATHRVHRGSSPERAGAYRRAALALGRLGHVPGAITVVGWSGESSAQTTARLADGLRADGLRVAVVDVAAAGTSAGSRSETEALPGRTAVDGPTFARVEPHRLSAAVNGLLVDHEVVLVGSGPIDDADLEHTLSAAPSAVLVVELGRTRHAELLHDIESVRAAGGRVVGAILLKGSGSPRRGAPRPRGARRGDSVPDGAAARGPLVTVGAGTTDTTESRS